MLNLAGNIFGCLFWGGLSALVLAGLTAFIAKGISGKALNPAVLVILTVCLLWQTILGTGALYAFSYVDEVHSYIQKIEHTSGNIDIDGAADELRRQFPQIPEKFIANISEANISSGMSIASAAAQSLKDSLKSYIWKRVLWSFIFMTAGCILLVKIPGSTGRGKGRRRGHHSVPQRDHYLEDLY